MLDVATSKSVSVTCFQRGRELSVRLCSVMLECTPASGVSVSSCSLQFWRALLCVADSSYCVGRQQLMPWMPQTEYWTESISV